MVAESTPRTVTAESNSKLNTGFVQAEGLKNCSFPAGLRVLVVDDDPICLLILDRMLRSCLYEVTCCERAIEALKLLREKKDGFDLVISDVYMPDMDGFKLLELVGLEMDLPVIMMSANGETSAVMKGIKHGACDYLLKPVRIEELKNIWQHVVRRKKKDSKRTGNLEDRQRLDDYSEYHTSASDGPDCASKQSKKRKDTEDEEEDTELDNDDPSTSKKPRVVWSVDLHQKFVNAVNQLGIDKAVPKRILDLMDVRGLTRENVASHLQKYRLYLKRISGLAHQAGSLGSSLSGVCEASFGAAGGGLGDLRAQLSPQVLVSMLPAGLLERLSSNNNFGVTGIDPSILQRIAAMHGVNSGALVRPSYGPSLVNNSGSLHPAISSGLDLNHLSQGPNQIALFDNGLAGLPNLQQASAAASFGGMGHVSRLNDHSPASSSNNSLAMQILQQQTVSQMGSGQQILSGDMGARLPNGSSFSIGRGTGVTSHFRSGQESSLSGPSFTPTNGLGSVRSVAVDIKNLNLSHGVTGSSSLPCNASSPSTSCGLVSGAIGIGQKGFASNATDSVPQSLREMVSNSPALSQGEASRLHMGLNDWQSCQSLGLSQESGQTVSPLWSPRYNQGFPSQAAQEQGSGRVSGFHDNFVDDRGLFKPLATTARSYNTQSRVESELKFKDSRFELQLGSKAGNGMMSNALSSSDDLLLSSYFKQQQQEVMGFTEGDLATEARTLGNMYVK